MLPRKISKNSRGNFSKIQGEFFKNSHFAKFSKIQKGNAVVLKLVGSIEPNRCHASIHRTLNYNQERIQKILEGDAVLN